MEKTISYETFEGVVLPFDTLAEQWGKSMPTVVGTPTARFTEQMANEFSGQKMLFYPIPGKHVEDMNTQIMPSFPSPEVEAQWRRFTWSRAMVAQVKPATLPDGHWAEGTKFKLIAPTTGLTYEERVSRMTEEFMQVWSNVLYPSCKTEVIHTFPTAPHPEAVDKLVRQLIEANDPIREVYGLDDMLRCFVEIKLADREILEMNSNLGALYYDYLRGWLTDAGFDSTTINLADNRIMNAKGQPMKLTKALASVLPESMPERALQFAREVAFARNDPTRESFLAYIAPALQGVARIGLTTNLSDLMTASAGGGFTSCHGPGGAHFSGNMGLALTPDVFLGFVGEPHAKKGRMWVYVSRKNMELFQLKTYGMFPSHFRKPLREYIEECLAPGQRWVHRAKVSTALGAKGAHNGYFDSAEIDGAYLHGRVYIGLVELNFAGARCVTCGEQPPSALSSHTCECKYCHGVQCARCKVKLRSTDPQHTHHSSVYCLTCWDASRVVCAECECGMHDADAYTIERYDVELGENVSVNICRDCFSNNYFECSHCGETRPQDEHHTIYTVDDGDRYEADWCDSCVEADAIYCESCGRTCCDDGYDHGLDCCVVCRDRNYTLCNECNNHVPNDEFNCDYALCDDCFDTSYFYCETCETTHHKDEVEFNSDLDMCEVCVEKHYVTCTHCGELTNRED